MRMCFQKNTGEHSGPTEVRLHTRAVCMHRAVHVRLLGKLGNAGLPVEGIGLDMIQALNRSLESCGLNSRTLNGLPSGRSFRTSRVVFPVLVATPSPRLHLRPPGRGDGQSEYVDPLGYPTMHGLWIS